MKLKKVLKKVIFFEVVKNKPAAQAEGQTLPNAITPVGKIRQFAVTFEPIQQFRSPSRFRISGKCQYSLFYDWKHYF